MAKNRIFITGAPDFDPLWMEKKFRRSSLRITDSVPHLHIWIAEFDTLSADPTKMVMKIKKLRSVKSLEFDRYYDPLDSREN